MISRVLALTLALVALFSSPLFAEKVPFPDWYYNERVWSYPEDLNLYKRYPVTVRGNPNLHPSTYAWIQAPRAINALFNHQRQTGLISQEEWSSKWSYYQFDWKSWFIVQINLYSEDIEGATTGGPYTGPLIWEVIAENSNGDRFVIDALDFTFPEEDGKEANYVNLIALTYPKEMIASRPEWVRLTVRGEDYEYYFHWDFEI